MVVFPSTSQGTVVPLYNGSQQGGFAPGLEHGLVFSVTSKLQVDALGRNVYNGVAGLINLWKNNILVASINVPTTAAQSGFYRYVYLPTPIIFNPGEVLTITSSDPGGGTGATDVWSVGANPGLTLIGTIVSTTVGSLSPDYSWIYPYTAPVNANAMFELLATPEPMTYLLLGSFLAFGCVTYFVRKKHQSEAVKK